MEVELLRRKQEVWVFAGSTGAHVQETSVARAWNRIRARLDRPLTLHSLRHTFATLSLEAGCSIKWVSEQLGHRDASITLNTYYHALPPDAMDLTFLPGSKR
jgi:integrase